MSDLENPTKSTASPPPPAGDVEGQAAEGGRTAGFGVTGIVRRWQRENLVKKGTLATRGLGFIFSLLSFLIMACNRHGNWQNFDNYDEYKYVLAMGILSTLYTGAQALRQLHELSTGIQLFPPRALALIDFIGDQIMAYLLISAASSAVPLTNNFRKGSDNIFTDSSAASIAMEFLAFFALALSSILSGYKLSTQSYI